MPALGKSIGLTLMRRGDWKAARVVFRAPEAKVKLAASLAVSREAAWFRKQVIETFDTSGASSGKKWAPNSEMTRKMKGSSKPLIDRGDLRASVRDIRRGPMFHFVGVTKKSRSRDGKSLANIAEVHEFGRVIVIPVTLKMLRFLGALFAKHGGGSGKRGTGKLKVGGTLVIKIPERSFLRQTFNHVYTKPGAASLRMAQTTARALRGQYGKL